MALFKDTIVGRILGGKVMSKVASVATGGILGGGGAMKILGNIGKPGTKQTQNKPVIGSKITGAIGVNAKELGSELGKLLSDSKGVSSQAEKDFKTGFVKGSLKEWINDNLVMVSIIGVILFSGIIYLVNKRR